MTVTQPLCPDPPAPAADALAAVASGTDLSAQAVLVSLFFLFRAAAVRYS
jgi:hypothetical protein